MTHRDGLSALSVRSRYRRDAGHHKMPARPMDDPYGSLSAQVGMSRMLDLAVNAIDDGAAWLRQRLASRWLFQHPKSQEAGQGNDN